MIQDLIDMAVYIVNYHSACLSMWINCGFNLSLFTLKKAFLKKIGFQILSQLNIKLHKHLYYEQFIQENKFSISESFSNNVEHSEMWIYQLWRKCRDYIHFAVDVLFIYCSYLYVYSYITQILFQLSIQT